MKELDLSGIDPLRRDEVRRRIGILNRYVALITPTTADAETHAAQMGIGVQQFYRLVKIWRLHRKPDLVGAGKRGQQRVRRDGISDATRRIVGEAMNELGADAQIEALLRAVQQRCANAGTLAPSRGALWTYVMDARATSPIRDELSRIVVGRVWAKLPTLHGHGVAFPEVAIAMILPKRSILGFDVSVDPNHRASAALALAQAFVSLPQDCSDTNVEMNAADFADVTAAGFANERSEMRPCKASTGRLIAENLGRVIGGMRILHRGHKAKPDRLLMARSVNALDKGAAVAEIARAIREHNVAAAGDGGTKGVEP